METPASSFSAWLAEKCPASPAVSRRAVTALFFMNGVLFASWASRVPAIQAAQGLGNGSLGLALLAMASGAFLAMPASGFLIARTGSRVLCQVSMLAYGAALPLLALANGLALFIPALFFFGAAHGTLDIAMNAQAVSVEKAYRRPIMSSFHALWSAGGLAGALLGGVFAAHGVGPETHFMLVALCLGFATLWVLPRLRDCRQEEAAAAGCGRSVGRFRLPEFSVSGKGLIALGVMALCVMMGEGAMADWSALYLKEAAGTGASLASVGYAAFSLAMVAGRFCGDALVSRLGPVFLARSAGGMAALGLVAALVFPEPTVVLAGFTLVGAGFSTVVPMVFTAAGNTTGISRGAALSAVSTIGYLGFLLGPPLIGFVAEGAGLRAALGLIAGGSLLITALAGGLGKAQRLE